eukprot:11190339-Lingulodinium_polyedra.AAC.1
MQTSSSCAAASPKISPLRARGGTLQITLAFQPLRVARAAAWARWMDRWRGQRKTRVSTCARSSENARARTRQRAYA